MDRKQYQKEYREKNREKIKQYQKQYQNENREHIKKVVSEYGKKWYKENKESKDAQNRAYQSTHKEGAVRRTQKYVSGNKEKVRSYNKQFDKGFSGKYRMVLSRHKSRWACPCISLEEFTQIVQRPCTYCGDKNRTKGIDRVDNKEGYTLNNSESCCKQCNYMKNNWTVDEFLSRINKICQHQKSK